MAFIYTVISFLVAIIVLVAVHEFGHFYVARLCGVHVVRFSLGFGRVLWRRHDRRGTEYTICALPFGGYVKMLDEREGDVPFAQLDQTFNRKTIGQRMAIFIAGPAANFILAIFLLWGLLLQGERGLIPMIAGINAGSIAANAGLEVGQEIIAIDGTPTPTEQAVQKQLIRRLGESGQINFTVRYPDSTLQYEVQARLDKWMQGVKDPDPLAGLGLDIGHPLQAVAGEIQPASVAERAGFKVGDKIISVDGRVVSDWRDWVNYVRAHPNQLLSVTVDRVIAGQDATGSKTVSLQVTPESFIDQGVSYGRVGMTMQRQLPPDDLLRHYQYSIGGALIASGEKAWEIAGFVLLSVKKLILGEISTKNLSGPISIAKVAGASAHNGLISFIDFIAYLSVLIGVFNLLPIPMLDGGHIAFLLAEAIRGKPLSEKVQVLGFQVGFMLVIGLSMVAMVNDVMRL
ncbi:MAG: RIP metalloprotease RseP [Pseudomonadota bacterium]